MAVFEIESRVGVGAQHIVGRLSNGLLIKYPHSKGGHWDKSTSGTALGNLRTLLDWNIPIPETDVVPEPTIDDGTSIIRPPYALLAEEIRGRVFREADLQNEKIRGQISELVSSSLRIRRQAGSAVDFLGGEALPRFFEYLFKEKEAGQLGAYNCLIDEKEQLKLIDTNLLDPGRAPYARAWLVDASIDLQHTLLAELLKNRALIKMCIDENYFNLTTVTAANLYRFSRGIEFYRGE